MKARAPGKLVVSGAYAVLEGAPAIVVAVDRFARSDASSRAQSPTAEVRHALGNEAPFCDVSDLERGGRKLGLGSSAAALVASLAAKWASEGIDVDSAAARHRLFMHARQAHAAVQGGGSGIDVAAATYGGALRYALPPAGSASGPAIDSFAWPNALVLTAFDSGTSARTSELLGRVSAWRARHPAAYSDSMRKLADAAVAAAAVITSGRAGEVPASLRRFADELAVLGAAADAPIVPPSFRELAREAAAEEAAFYPSGAGGGDVALFVAMRAPSPQFVARAQALGMNPVDLAICPQGVTVEHASARVPDAQPSFSSSS